MKINKKKYWIYIALLTVFLATAIQPSKVSARAKKIVTNPVKTLTWNDDYALTMDYDTNQLIEYTVTSSNPDIIFIQQWKGRYYLKALKIGKSVIEVKDENGKVYQSFPVTVKKVKYKTFFTPTTEVVDVGKKVKLTKTKGLTYTSRFPNVATVSKDGTVTTKREGTTFIVAEDKYGNVDCKAVIVMKDARLRKSLINYEKKLRKTGHRTIVEDLRKSFERMDSTYIEPDMFKESIYEYAMNDGTGWGGYPYDLDRAKMLDKEKISKDNKFTYFFAYFGGSLLWSRLEEF